MHAARPPMLDSQHLVTRKDDAGTGAEPCNTPASASALPREQPTRTDAMLVLVRADLEWHLTA